MSRAESQLPAWTKKGWVDPAELAETGEGGKVEKRESENTNEVDASAAA